MTTLKLSTDYAVASVDRRLFSGFVEHLGRCVYEGIYDPGSPLADEQGWRRDVIEAIKPLAMPLMRYPGGNFVSCYDWWDGIGPRENRPRRLDYAWKSVETNHVGIDEFVRWCRQVETEPMMAVNLGTRGAAEAQAVVEYCNMPGGSKYADMRIANGHRDPYGIKVWCLGNEMDGPWQAGHVPAEEYARRADAAAKMIRGLDPTIELVLCGSSGRGMSTYLEYDRISLDYCWDHVQYVSAHRYSNNGRNDSAWFLAEGVEIQRVIDDYRGLFAYVRGKRRSNKQVHLSFDEWNVWYKNMEMDGKWTEAPHLLEEIYNLEDALVCAQYLTAFVRNADVVKIACIAQMVNVIAPILTRRDGLLIQSIYHPLAWFAKHARGQSLQVKIDGPTYKAGDRGDVPAIDAAATYDSANGILAIFVVNRHGSQELTVRLEDQRMTRVIESTWLGGADLKLDNTWDQPDRVKPVSVSVQLTDGRLSLLMPTPGTAMVRISIR
jgi:alpha-N-arabinofuranosidase